MYLPGTVHRLWMILGFFYAFPLGIAAQTLEITAIPPLTMPLQGPATVVIDNPRVGLPQYSFTTNTGTYSTDALPGRYNVTVRADGFKTVSGAIEVPASGAARLTLHLAPPPPPEPLASPSSTPATCSGSQSPCITLTGIELLQQLNAANEQLEKTHKLTERMVKFFSAEDWTVFVSEDLN